MEEIVLCQPIKTNKCEHNVVKYYCKKCGGNGICQHNIRKSRCKECGGGSICEHGRRKYQCKECGGKGICEHDKIKSHCKECGGASICEHDKIKSNCKECCGTSICEHGRRKSNCKECGGSQICEHGRRKSNCKECGGSQICEHNKIKSNCKECGGGSICEHGKKKSICKECYGGSICKHNKIKSSCKECGGSSICQHNKYKTTCKECGGSQICEHNRKKTCCKECGGSQICEHGRRKSLCKDCGGSSLCKSELCDTQVRSKYNGYCVRCFIHLFPDQPVTRNYKTKETSVAQFITTNFQNFTWNLDKKIEYGCSKRRPDLMCDLGYQVIIVEIDENQHTDYDCSCENKRMMQLSQDVEHRPIIFIRFNPDEYINATNEKITSCWGTTPKTGILKIKNNKINEWNERLDILKETIEYWSNQENKTEKTVEVIQLFYNQNT